MSGRFEIGGQLFDRFVRFCEATWRKTEKDKHHLSTMGRWFEGNGEKAGWDGISAGTRLDYAKGVIEGHGGLGKMVGPCPDCLF